MPKGRRARHRMACREETGTQSWRHISKKSRNYVRNKRESQSRTQGRLQILLTAEMQHSKRTVSQNIQ